MTRNASRAHWVEVVRRRVQRKFAEARLYRALAAREPCGRMRAIWQLLARSAERAAWRSEERLWRLGVMSLPAYDSWHARAWRWLLVRAGKRAALGYLSCAERREHKRLMSLLRRRPN